MSKSRRVVALVIGVLAGAARVEATCWVTTTPVSFGSYNVYAMTPVDTTATVTWWCDLTVTSPTVAIGKGGSTTFDPRQMSKGSEQLNYNLYRDSARSQIWGDGTSGTSVYTHSGLYLGLNEKINLTIYGRLPALQDVSAGSYTDSVTVTIQW